MRILVAGAGIAGLTFANLAAQRGIDIAIFEQSTQMTEIGAGIQISANAGHVLTSLGLGEGLAQAGYSPEVWHMRVFDTGEVLNSIDLGAHHARLHGQPYYNVHRADVQRMLLDLLEKTAPDALRLGREVTHYEAGPLGAVLHFADGSREHGDAVVGADGVKSALRAQIIGPDRPVYSGNSAWRGMIPADRLPAGFSARATNSFMGPGRHMVMYWVGGGTHLNFVAPVETAQASEESWTTRHDWADLKADFEGWHDNVQTVIDAADPDQCYRWALNIRQPVAGWCAPRAVLIGDAVHATLPYLAQGAAMAIEDAAVLARLLEVELNIDKAFQRLEILRLPRTARIVNGANRIARMFHHPTREALIEGMAKGADVARGRDGWLYNYNPMTVDLA